MFTTYKYMILYYNKLNEGNSMNKLIEKFKNWLFNKEIPFEPYDGSSPVSTYNPYDNDLTIQQMYDERVNLQKRIDKRALFCEKERDEKLKQRRKILKKARAAKKQKRENAKLKA